MRFVPALLLVCVAGCSSADGGVVASPPSVVSSQGAVPPAPSVAPDSAQPQTPRYAGSRFEVDPAEPLPRGAVARCGTARMRAPSSAVIGVTTDGKLYVVEPGSGEVAVRELTGDKTAATLDGASAVWIAPDARRLVRRRSYGDATLHLHAIPSGERLGELTVPLQKAPPAKRLGESLSESISAVEMSLDGSTLLVQTSKGKLHVADGRTGALRRTVGAPPGSLVGLSRDGARALVVTRPEPKGLSLFMAAGDATGFVVVDLASGRTLRREEFPLEKPQPGRVGPTRAHAYARFGLDLDGATVYRLESGDLDAVDVATGKVRAIAQRARASLALDVGGLGAGNHLEMHPNGRHAIDAGSLLSLRDGARREIDGRVAAVSADGAHVVTRVGETLRMEGVETRDGHDAAVASLGFLPGGGVLVTADGHLGFWDVADCGRVARPATRASQVRVAASAPLLVVGGYPSLFIDADGRVTTVKKVLRHEHVAAAPSGDRVFAGFDGYEAGSSLVAFDLTGKELTRVALSRAPSQLDVSPSGARVAVRSGFEDTGRVEVRRTTDLGVEVELPTSAQGVVFAGDDRLVVQGYRGFEVLSLPSLRSLGSVGAGACCDHVAVSRDGKRIAGAADGRLYVWDVDPPKLVAELPGHTRRVSSLAFSPDGTILASGSADTTVLLWDLSSPPAPRVDSPATPWGAGPSSVDAWARGDRAGAAFVSSDGTLRALDARVALPKLTGVTALSLGYGASCALASAGVQCWGSTRDGALGIPEEPGVKKYQFKERDAPVAVPSIVEPVALSMAGSYACAREAGGAAVCWGRLGATPPQAPRRMPGQILEVVVGRGLACTLGQGGSIACWSDGTKAPAALPGVPKSKALAVGSNHACALAEDGRVSCWGSGASDQMGDGLGRDRSAPATVAGLAGVAQIAARENATCARTAEGDVLCWGSLGSAALVVPTPLTALRGTKGLLLFQDGRVCAEAKSGVVCVAPRP